MVAGKQTTAPLGTAARRAVVFLFTFSVVLAGANLFWTSHAVNVGDRRWCATMVLLTARAVPKPADPKANPSREQAYIFYSDFRELRRRLGCG